MMKCERACGLERKTKCNCMEATKGSKTQKRKHGKADHVGGGKK